MLSAGNYFTALILFQKAEVGLYIHQVIDVACVWRNHTVDAAMKFHLFTSNDYFLQQHLGVVLF